MDLMKILVAEISSTATEFDREKHVSLERIQRKRRNFFFFPFRSEVKHYEFFCPNNASHAVSARRLREREVQYSSWLIEVNSHRELLKSSLKAQ